ncbi:hypothetical protein ACWDA7_28045 [Streptomyces sp. NPDC001156]
MLEEYVNDDLVVFRAREDVWILDQPPGPTTVVLAGGRGSYLRLPHNAWDFLRELSGCPQGMTPAEAGGRYPEVRFGALAKFGLIDIVPARGIRAPWSLTARLWRQNLLFRVRIAAQGWRGVQAMMERGASADGRIPLPRPLFFDELETAARLSFSWPGTSRQCTVVSLTIDSILRRSGYASRVVVLGEHDQVFLHASVRVGLHIIDPGDTLAELQEFKRLRPFTRDGHPRNQGVEL